MEIGSSKFRKFVNIAEIVIFTGLLLCVIGSYLIAKLGIRLPEWTNIGVEQSYFDGRSYQKVPKPSLNSFISGDFQEKAEQWASDHIPFRNVMLVTNATLQRYGIRTANMLSGFDCYPTYYGSKQIETSDIQHVMFASQAVTDEDIARMNSFANNLNEMTAEYDDVRFTIFAIDDNRWSDANPSAKYTTNSSTDIIIDQQLWQRLDKRITVISSDYLTYEQYFDYFLPTEHHWSFKGWSKAYEQLAEVLQWKTLKDIPVYSLDEYPAFGGTARLGLDLDTSKYVLQDYDMDFPDLQWKVGDEFIAEPGNRHIYRSDGAPSSRYKDYQLYDDFYGDNYPELEIINSHSDNLNDAIVITNSYGKPLLPYIAQNYNTVIKLDPSNQVIDTKLREVLDNKNCTDVIIILAPQSIASEHMAESSLFE